MSGFRCSKCGQWHDELPLDVGAAEPLYVEELSPDEKAQRVSGEPGSDFRVLRRNAAEVHYFIRGVIEIPVLGTDETFCYGVWTSLSESSYEKANAAYRVNGSAGPLFGWLSNRLAGYPETLSLKTHVRVRPDLKASIELEPIDHPLAREQREGISIERVQQIVEPLMHPSEDSTTYVRQNGISSSSNPPSRYSHSISRGRSSGSS